MCAVARRLAWMATVVRRLLALTTSRSVSQVPKSSRATAQPRPVSVAVGMNGAGDMISPSGRACGQAAPDGPLGPSAGQLSAGRGGPSDPWLGRRERKPPTSGRRSSRRSTTCLIAAVFLAYAGRPTAATSGCSCCTDGRPPGRTPPHPASADATPNEGVIAMPRLSLTRVPRIALTVIAALVVVLMLAACGHGGSSY